MHEIDTAWEIDEVELLAAGLDMSYRRMA